MAATNLLTGTINWDNYKPVSLPLDVSTIKDVPSLNQALHTGQINQGQWMQRFQQIQPKINGVNTPKAYSLGNALNAAGQAVNKVIVKPVVGTAEGVAQQAARAANMIGETPVGRLSGAPSQSQTVEQTAAQIQKQALAKGMKPADAATLANQVRQKGYSDILNQAGIGLNDSKATVARKAVGNIGGTVANVLPVGEALKSASLAGRVVKSAALGGAATGVSNLSADKLTPKSEAKAIAGGTLLGGALPLGVEGVRSLAGRVKGTTSGATEVASTPKIPSKTTSPKAASVTNSSAKIVPTEEELSMGKALGMSPEQVQRAKAEMINPPVRRGVLPKEPTTTPNPIKYKLSNPEAGDYGAAITDKQRVDSGISLAATRATNAVKKLSSNDRKLFAYARENPNLVKKAENPTQMQDALNKFGKLTDTAHAFDVAAGGKTPHIANYYRHNVDLSAKNAKQAFSEIAQQKGFTIDPFSYEGLNRQPRVFKTIKEGEAAGFKFNNLDPLKEINDYANAARGVIGRQALARGAQLADAARGTDAALTEKFKVGPGRYIDVSPEAAKKLRGVEELNPSSNKVIKGLRTANAAVKSTVLSLGQFHTINIGAMRAAPTLIAKGHPVAAAKGLYGMFRGAFGTKFADNVIGKAIDDGTVDKAAKIGMPYGGTGYNTEGTFLKHGIGSRTVFGKQIPMMHDQVVRSIIADLEKKNVSLDSKEARTAGLAGANMMGEVNRELQNIRPSVKKAMSDWLLAGQFTPSKFMQVGRALTKGGVGGSYARANVAANVAGAVAIATAIGSAFHQKSDNARDILLRAIFDPSAPTPLKDSKGNTLRIGTPSTDTADIAKLLGITLVRNPGGHLGISWDIHNAPPTVEEFLRNRLSPGASAGVQVATNTQFGNKQLYNPRSQPGGKAIQIGTQLVSENLPIGLQGIVFTNSVKNKLPKSSQTILNSNTPGTNPIVKSVSSSLGFTPKTDTTVGKGLVTTLTNSLYTQKNKALPEVQAAAKAQVKAGDIATANKTINDYNKKVLQIAKTGYKTENKPVPDDATLIKQLKKSGFYYAPKQTTIAGWANKKTVKGGFSF